MAGLQPINKTLENIALQALSRSLADSTFFPERTASEVLARIMISPDGYSFHEDDRELGWRIVRTFVNFSAVVYDLGGPNKHAALNKYRRDMERFDNQMFIDK